jgi:aspartyl-tRNA(Asn)/glutamyl-tRNA(Gln) amidotransferase subunit A
MARYDGIRYGSKTDHEVADLIEYFMQTRGEGFGSEMKRRIMIGTYALSAGYYDAYYVKAQKVRTKIIEDFKAAFEKFDALIAPVSPFPAFGIGEKADDPLQMYLADALTIPVNAAGLPAVSVPCGFTKNGLPLSFQVIAPQFREDLVLKIGDSYERQFIKN